MSKTGFTLSCGDTSTFESLEAPEMSATAGFCNGGSPSAQAKIDLIALPCWDDVLIGISYPN